MIAAIMPCRGRAEQTVRNVKRLLATAGSGMLWHLWCVVDNDPDIYQALGEFGTGELTRLALPIDRKSGYWSAMALGTEETSNGYSFLVNLANDLLPGRDWLARALAEYRCCFGTRDAMIGFNDGIHQEGLSPHFLISRGLLNQFGGWPMWYKHEYGDAELCARAQAAGVYSKAAYAVLYHDHPFVGGDTDSVYAEGQASRNEDAALFAVRRKQGWPEIRNS